MGRTGYSIKSLVSPSIRNLRAYNAKEIPCRVKLDANESPYGFDITDEILKSIKTNRYPDPEAKTLKKIIAKNLRLNPENILFGNGSDELIYYLTTVFGGPVLYPVPTFSMYGIISQALGEKRIEVPLDDEFDLDTDRILSLIKKEKPGIIFLSSPNNPTGNCFSSDRILKIIETSSLVTGHLSLVVIDEAYQPFSSEKGFLPMLSDYKNLVILRTLSKIGFAGLRVGFMIADREIINEVNKVRLPFNLNSLSQAVAAALIKNTNTIKLHIGLITSERERLLNELWKIRGIKPYPSEANFILFRTENSDKIYYRLLKRGVLVRNMKGTVNGCLRVTVGTKKENNIFIKALKEVMK
ncbi:MAG: histidinol-phosphate transaminase [Thermodesulfovibrionales bacterium]|nr:histidinol-phosphate transaminase [Thermodesulfovibrionales bacterium]